MKNAMKTLVASLAAVSAIGLFAAPASARVLDDTQATGPQAASSALAVPSCVKAQPYWVEGPFEGVGIVNHCSYWVSVYAIWDWGPDSVCLDIAPGNGTSHESFGSFNRLESC
ncbi:hypothetical protein [Streptosporangium carneum]|uniref:Secreted protein n=1 Tax=Streptosporangium carneum TaxID=47481 RepID=A0A9W6HX64_9ACTN|nr:hypothetical protein [Streptosporangium carneum]GLK07223.1 hypothetical protein GCM10017600_06280 [Streptosporangium carneum]